MEANKRTFVGVEEEGVDNPDDCKAACDEVRSQQCQVNVKSRLYQGHIKVTAMHQCIFITTS